MTTESDGAVGEMITALGKDLRQMIQQELVGLRSELRDTARAGRKAAALMGGAGLLGALAAGTSAVVIVRLLDEVLPRPLAGLVTSVLFGAGAAALARLGLAELRRAGENLPSS